MVKRSSRSGRWLLLTGLLIACLIFALASAICVRIFTYSRRTAEDSMNLNNAITAAVGGAEVFKTAEGDRERTADILGAQLFKDGVRVFYDEQWRETGESDRSYTMEIIWRETIGYLVYANVTVSSANRVLFSLNTTALKCR